MAGLPPRVIFHSARITAQHSESLPKGSRSACHLPLTASQQTSRGPPRGPSCSCGFSLPRWASLGSLTWRVLSHVRGAVSSFHFREGMRSPLDLRGTRPTFTSNTILPPGTPEPSGTFWKLLEPSGTLYGLLSGWRRAVNTWARFVQSSAARVLLGTAALQRPERLAQKWTHSQKQSPSWNGFRYFLLVLIYFQPQIILK